METRIQGVPGHSWLRWWVEEVMSPVGGVTATDFLLFGVVPGLGSGEG